MSTTSTTIHTQVSTPADETFNIFTGAEVSPESLVTQELVFNKGFGRDTVVIDQPREAVAGPPYGIWIESQPQPHVIKLGAGIAPSDIQLVRLDDAWRYIPSYEFGTISVREQRWELRVRHANDRILFSDPAEVPASATTGSHDALRSLVRIEFADGTVWTPQDVLLALQRPGNAQRDVYGTSGDDLLMGDAAPHHILGGAGNDTLVSGVGNDQLVGGPGHNVYRFNGATGHDTLIGHSGTVAGVSESSTTIEFGAAIQADDVSFSWAGHDLLVNLADGSTIRVAAQAGPGLVTLLPLSAIVFANGTSWSAADINQRVDNSSTDGKDQLQSYGSPLLLTGGAGDDVLKGFSGQDTLLGGAGHDTLTGDHIVAEGGAGNDAITAGSGVIRYRPGFGQDTLTAQWDWADLQLEFLDGIRLQDVGFYQTAQGLVIRLESTGDSVLMRYAMPANMQASPGRIVFADGQTVSFLDAVEGRANTLVLVPSWSVQRDGTAGADTLVGSINSELFIDSPGDDVYEMDATSGRDSFSSWEGLDTDRDIVRVRGVKPAEVMVRTGYGASGSLSTIVTFNNVSELDIGHGIFGEEPRVPNERLALHFDDGTVWGINDLYARLALGTSGNDLIFSTSRPDRYVFGAGSGQDRINDSLGWRAVGGFKSDPSDPDNADRVLLTSQDVTFAYANTGTAGGKNAPPSFSGIAISVVGTTDRLEIFNGSGQHNFLNSTLPVVEFPDGTTLTGQQIRELIANPPLARPPVVSHDQFIAGTFRDDMLFGGSGNDLIEVGQGDDHVDTAHGGRDTLVAWAGDGSDTLVGSIDMLRLRGDIHYTDVHIGHDRISVIQQERVVYELAAAKEQVRSIMLDNGIVISTVNAPPQGSMLNDLLIGTDGDDFIDGLAGFDTIHGGLGNDTLVGGTMPSILHGGGGKDVLISKGADELRGGRGADIFRFFDIPRGALIADSIEDLVGDTILIDRPVGDFTIGFVNFDDRTSLLLLADGEWWRPDLEVRHFVVPGQDSPQMADIQMQFADGRMLDAHDLYIAALRSTAGNDQILGSLSDDPIMGGAGDDYLLGFAGDDALAGGSGNDALVGGTGGDLLIGGTGNDTYQFYRGDGDDTILDRDGTAGNNDRIVFNGASADQLWLSRNGDALEIATLDTSDRVSITSWFAGSAYQVETIVDRDGQQLNVAEINNLISAMAAFSPTSAGITVMPGALAEVVDNSWR